MNRILIADDAPKIRMILKDAFEHAGYQVTEAVDGKDTLDCFQREFFDIILLDVMMPKYDGFEVCKIIRETSNIPIIMITARGDDYDRIMGLDIGADDYIVKPFVPAEVLARVRAVLRRIEPQNKNNQLMLGNLKVNIDDYSATISNQEVSLTKKEIEILWTLAKNPNKVLSRDQLLDHVWGIDYYGDVRTVDAHIKRLRSKISEYNLEGWEISTVWGVGYKLEVSS